MFDPPERVPYSRIPYAENDSRRTGGWRGTAERAAIVLLKNEGGVLPLNPSLRKIAVVGTLRRRSRRAAG